MGVHEIALCRKGFGIAFNWKEQILMLCLGQKEGMPQNSKRKIKDVFVYILTSKESIDSFMDILILTLRLATLCGL